MKCDECMGEIWFGDWPFCGGDPSKHVPARNFGEEPMESYVDLNLTDEPEGIEITTRAQRRKIMDENHFEYRKKQKPTGSTLFFDMARR